MNWSEAERKAWRPKPRPATDPGAVDWSDEEKAAWRPEPRRPREGATDESPK